MAKTFDNPPIDYAKRPVKAPSEIKQFDKVPSHIALIMDGNGRWANSQGFQRSVGHRAGEWALMDTIAGAVEAGVKYLSVYAFSTENWKRSPSEVRFLMGYSREVLRRRRDTLHDWNVRIRWSGRTPRLWKSVIKELRAAEALTQSNTGLTFTMCVNYGGRAEIRDAVEQIARRVENGQLSSRGISEKTIARHLYVPDVPDVDLMIRSSGEQRISNYLLWQAAYAEFMFVPEPWPEFRREVLWRCIDNYGSRERRFGGAEDKVAGV